MEVYFRDLYRHLDQMEDENCSGTSHIVYHMSLWERFLHWLGR
jgi:hypothetical protein